MQYSAGSRAVPHYRASGALLVGVVLFTEVIGRLPAQPRAASEVVLYSFKGPLHGWAPSSVIRDSSGNLYGTTTGGGPAGHGVVFKLDPMGHETLLYSFTGGADGGAPQTGGLIGDEGAGIAYGTAFEGGSTTGVCAPRGCGVVFQVDAAGHETVLHTFTGADGSGPVAGVIRDRFGNFYGTTFYGGTTAGSQACASFGCGVVFKLDTAGNEIVLHTFTGGANGGNPSGLSSDPAGNLYGTAYLGGNVSASCGIYGCGVVFKIDTAGNYTVLYSFVGGTDGHTPTAGVIRDSIGNLYGTTIYGGTATAGVVYKLDTAGQETVLYTFTGGSDGAHPYSLIGDSAGNLYGITSQGGIQTGPCALPEGCGVVYKLDPTRHETVLYSFTGGADGANPQGLIRDSAGNLYGAAIGPVGSVSSNGVVFKLDTAGHQTVLYSFSTGADGSEPFGAVIGDSAGNLYGTTAGGGSTSLGVVFKLDPGGHETVSHTFKGGADGANPQAGLIRDPAGNLYGTATGGGASNAGVVYKLDTAGNETVLHTFTGGADGGDPQAGLIGDAAGNLYGTARIGGTAGAGVVFKLDSTGHGTVLHTFTGATDGANPQAGLIRDSSGNLYGTTTFNSGGGGCGVIFKVDTANQETVLHRFSGADGCNPAAGVIGDGSGNAYGTTSRGGTGGWGVVYKLDAAGHYSVLYNFTGGLDGGYPEAGVIRDSAGSLYGTTRVGGATNGRCQFNAPIPGCGVVFKVDTTGHETILYTFMGGSDGGSPSSGLVPDSAGNLYGVARFGGTADAGVVYKIRP